MKLPWMIASAAVTALAAVLVVGRARHATRHPDPRLRITAEQVLPPGMAPHTPGSVEAYAAALAVPAVLDGLYCHCNCSRTFGHRSLLTCFESDHGAYCDICMGEATTAARLAQAGGSLQQIRAAIDRQFGS
ncbi:MAG: hypothetical protein AUH46_05620 [Gemmatimonadetes bacterium 13_1_40CM_70_15]|nr:MAG: hypothetical protein AUH46_05620 [Gemmatimonadetes bacterium 13_1_40CM_70_15]